MTRGSQDRAMREDYGTAQQKKTLPRRVRCNNNRETEANTTAPLLLDDRLPGF